jgi:hypothetical protein
VRTILGSKVPLRSRGTSTSTGPMTVTTVLVRLPLRELPLWGPARSWGSSPTCSVISASSAVSSTVLVRPCNSPPGPTRLTPSARARSISWRATSTSVGTAIAGQPSVSTRSIR